MNESFYWRDAPAADFAVIGDPVAHSLSPQIHRAAYTALGLDCRYVAIQVPMSEVDAALGLLTEYGYRGVNVTVPNKSEALKWATHPDQLSIRIGAANTLDLRDGSAINTDAPGFVDTLADFHFGEAPGALILGAGGSARAMAVALTDSGFAVSIWNRTPARAIELADEFGLKVAEQPSARYDLIVNTTSTGLHAESLPIDWSDSKPETIAYDLVYGSTPFLSGAASHGLRVTDGKKLLVAQGARSLEWWLGVPAPREAMMEAIR